MRDLSSVRVVILYVGKPSFDSRSGDVHLAPPADTVVGNVLVVLEPIEWPFSERPSGMVTGIYVQHVALNASQYRLKACEL